jgi:hypothetical protein
LVFTSVFERKKSAGDDYLLCAFVARDDQSPPHPERLDGAGLKAHVANTALRDAALLTHRLSRAAQGQLPLPDAISPPAAIGSCRPPTSVR